MRASSIGDCLMGKYLLEQIHARYPAAACRIVVASRAAMIRDLLAAYPWLTVVEASRRDPCALARALRILWNSDAAVTQYTGRGQFSTVSKLFARLVTRRGWLVGFDDPWRWNRLVYDHVVPFDSARALILHERDALRALGVPVAIPRPTLQYLRDTSAYERFGLRRGGYVLLHLFAGTAGRGLTVSRRRVHTRALAAACGGRYTLVLSGSAADRADALAAAAGLPLARVLAGETSIPELLNLIAGSAGVVSVDTGVAHMAAHLGVPVVVLRSCFARQWWVPEQYDGPVVALSRDGVCAQGHVADTAGNCVNSVAVEEMIRGARFHILK